MGAIDAYLSNGHKWLSSPKGSAFPWVNKTVVSKIFPEPTVISSSNLMESSFVNRYLYVSTLDYTAPIAMAKALEFRKYIGGEDAIYEYTRNLALEAKHYLMDLWNADSLVPDSMEEFMVNIALPISDKAVANDLKEHLLREHNMYIVILFYEDILFTRLSSQIYLEMSDFVLLGELVQRYVQTMNIREQ
jgi:selenocysteine lyase/cysteine desulfurase